MSTDDVFRFARVNLSTGRVQVLEKDESFRRRYYGGRGVISYFLLNELDPGADPLGPENKLIFALGLLTGIPLAGTGRNSVGAKSPLTGGYGDAEAGGWWGAELRRTGFEAIVVEGRALEPVFLWVHDGVVEIRDASHLWGRLTGEAQAVIRQELGDERIRTALIGPAGERLVRFACVANDLKHFAGRSGLGAVMGSKNLKGVAVRGHQRPKLADRGSVGQLATWLNENYMARVGALYDYGTAVGLLDLNSRAGLPSRNFQDGSFPTAVRISGEALAESILKTREGCYACPVRCKRVVDLSEPYRIDPAYGGPEYESIAALGSNCGIDDLRAIAKANELCAAYGMDTISTGVTIAWAMECFQRGLLTPADTDGLSLQFGDSEGLLRSIEAIAQRQGFGDVLAEGVRRASQRVGRGTEQYALHVKGQEVPMHEPRFKQGMGLGYAVSPTGADHCHSMHDSMYERNAGSFEDLKAFGVIDPLPVDDLGAGKVRMAVYDMHWRHLVNCLGLCLFMPYSYDQVVDLVRATAGWNSTIWELLKVGERATTLARAFNVREGLDSSFDNLPSRFFEPFGDGPLRGTAIPRAKLDQARTTYYEMMGWSRSAGAPTKAKLEELDVGWVADHLDQTEQRHRGVAPDTKKLK